MLGGLQEFPALSGDPVFLFAAGRLVRDGHLYGPSSQGRLQVEQAEIFFSL